MGHGLRKTQGGEDEQRGKGSEEMSIAVVLCNLMCLAVLAPAEPAMSFDTEIIPVLTKSGCNSGACHGAAAGRGGFHLSLLGANPALDYEAIVQALEGRRVNLAHPERSLILLKASEQIEHGGDVALESDGPGFEKVLHWLRLGAPRGPERHLVTLDVSPTKHLVEGVPSEVRLRVVAKFSDGSENDVTAWTLFHAADPGSVEIDQSHRARVLRRGQHVIVARYLDRVLPIQIIAPLSDGPIDLRDEHRVNFIDHEVLRVLEDLHVPVSPSATDSVWLRRVSLDLTGRLPEPAETDEFLRSKATDKRPQLVDRLLRSEAFTDYWTMRFSRLLRIHSLPNDDEGVRAYGEWLRACIRDEIPLNVMASELLTATGDSHVIGAANFGRMVGDARDHAELVGQFFLGARLGCANCHNHPLDKWTQDDYHGLAAVFARMDRGRDVKFLPRGDVTNLRTNQPAIPRIPGERDLPVDGDHRFAVAAWLTTGQNQYFAKAMVNRLWRTMFGRGLVEPTDDLRDTNPATHPTLLNLLAEDFIVNGYQIRKTLRTIALSTTYGRCDGTVAGNESDDRFYSHSYRRRLEPEVLMDAIADATGVPGEYFERAAGTRAVQIIDVLQPSPSLDLLGRCSRAEGCDETVVVSEGLSTKLHLLNGELVNARVASPSGRLHRLIDEGRSDDIIIHDFYLRAFCCPPSQQELTDWGQRMADSDPLEHNRKREDFVWSLLNSRKFLENR